MAEKEMQQAESDRWDSLWADLGLDPDEDEAIRSETEPSPDTSISDDVDAPADVETELDSSEENADLANADVHPLDVVEDGEEIAAERDTDSEIEVVDVEVSEEHKEIQTDSAEVESGDPELADTEFVEAEVVDEAEGSFGSDDQGVETELADSDEVIEEEEEDDLDPELAELSFRSYYRSPDAKIAGSDNELDAAVGSPTSDLLEDETDTEELAKAEPHQPVFVETSQYAPTFEQQMDESEAELIADLSFGTATVEDDLGGEDAGGELEIESESDLFEDEVPPPIRERRRRGGRRGRRDDSDMEEESPEFEDSEPDEDEDEREKDNDRRRGRGRGRRRNGEGRGRRRRSRDDDATIDEDRRSADAEDEDNDNRRSRRTQRIAAEEESMDFETERADRSSRIPTSVAQTQDEELEELFRDWNVPSWQEIVSGLYRPDRDR